MKAKKFRDMTPRERAQARKLQANDAKKGKQYVNVRNLHSDIGVQTVAEFMSYTEAHNSLEGIKNLYPGYIVFISLIASRDWDDTMPGFNELARRNLHKG